MAEFVYTYYSFTWLNLYIFVPIFYAFTSLNCLHTYYAYSWLYFYVFIMQSHGLTFAYLLCIHIP